MKSGFLVLAACVGTLLTVSSVQADMSDAINPRNGKPSQGRWHFGVGVSFISTTLDIVDADVDAPEDLLLRDVALDVSDVSIKGTAVAASVSYFVLPFLSINANGGFLSSTSTGRLRLSGTPDLGLDLVTFDEPLTFEFDREVDIEAYTVGVGVGAYIPLVLEERNKLILRGGANLNFANADENETQTRTFTKSATLIYARPVIEIPSAFGVGLSHTSINRSTEMMTEFAGETIRVDLEQELADPWSVNASTHHELTKHFAVGYGVSHNFDAGTSHMLHVSFKP